MKVGILGAGNIAHTMAKTLCQLNDQDIYLDAIGASNLVRSQEFAATYNINKAYGTYEELVNDQDIDLVYIATIHPKHYEHARLCIEHGKHVLVEKPFTLNQKQAKELFELGRKHNVLVAEAMWTKYMPSRYFFNKITTNTVIGELQSVVASIGYELSQVERMNKLELGAGALLDLGIYPITFAQMVFDATPTVINGSCVKNSYGADVTDSISLTMPYGIATLHATSVSNSDNGATIYGSKGRIGIDNINNPKVATIIYNDGSSEIYEFPKQITGFEYQVIACKKAIDEQLLETKEHTHQDILNTLAIMDTLRSAWNISYPNE